MLTITHQGCLSRISFEILDIVPEASPDASRHQAHGPCNVVDHLRLPEIGFGAEQNTNPACDPEMLDSFSFPSGEVGACLARS